MQNSFSQSVFLSEFRAVRGIGLMKRSISAAVFILILSVAAAAQGGNAGPRRIELVNGRNSITLTGILSNSQEMEFVFHARKGRVVSLKMSSSNLFDFRLFNAESDFDTEFDSSSSATHELPADGDYYLFVRKKMVGRPRTARFKLFLAIK